MATTTRSTVVGIFEDHPKAERAIEELRRNGFREDQIGVAARDPGVPAAATAPSQTNPPEPDAVSGAVTGGILVGLLGAVATGLIPGIGPAIAAGLLTGILGGAALGAVAGGLLGALIGMGVPEEEARHYEREFQAGRTIVTVRADGRSEDAAAVLRRFGASTEPRPSIHPPVTA